jgi:hypothetical protein
VGSMPGISQLFEQSLLTANTVWRKLARPVFRLGRTSACVVPMCPAGAGSGIGFVAIFYLFPDFW